MTYLSRSLEPLLSRAVREFPAVVLTGPRQSGKTTLLRRLFGATHRYVSLELPDVRAAALADPRTFLAVNPPPVIYDEAHYATELLAYIKEDIDRDRSRRGQYLLTSSQNLLLAERAAESLAGRAAVLRLLPLSHREAAGRPHAALPWEAAGIDERRAAAPAFEILWRDLLRGGYPEIVTETGRDLRLWHGSYVQTYLERDLRSLRQVGDLASFQAFLRALAARSGQLLHLSDLARDLGVVVNTLKAWLSVLEATFQVIVLRPYFANTGKRLVKTPKVFFTDTGTLCYLTGLTDPGHAAAGPLGGAIFETAVLSEVVKTLAGRGGEPEVYFWRTSTGVEVDLIVATEGKLIPIEAKLSATPRPAMGDAIRQFQRDLPGQAQPGYVVHPGDVRLPLGPGVAALPFGQL